MKQKGRRISLDNLFEKSPPNTKRVTRTSRWGNPYKLDGTVTREESLQMYEEYLEDRIHENPKFLEPLKNKNLACFCDIDKKCHVDILLKFLS